MKVFFHRIIYFDQIQLNNHFKRKPLLSMVLKSLCWFLILKTLTTVRKYNLITKNYQHQKFAEPQVALFLSYFSKTFGAISRKFFKHQFNSGYTDNSMQGYLLVWGYRHTILNSLFFVTLASYFNYGIIPTCFPVHSGIQNSFSKLHHGTNMPKLSISKKLLGQTLLILCLKLMSH